MYLTSLSGRDGATIRGEEVESLRRAGIEPVVINGITSGLAAITSLGAPLTHREHAQGVVFVTGHPQKDGPGLDWVRLAESARDLRLTLVEPLLRRVNWLERVCTDLALPNVEVVRGRAEEQWGRLEADVVTARAVAALDRLAGWGLPLVRDGGQLIALKGASAHDELAEVREALPGWGVAAADIVSCGDGVVDPPTLVTRLRLADPPAPGTLSRPARRKPARTGPADTAADRRSGRRGAQRNRARGRR